MFLFAVQGFPACGMPQEVLSYHRLDGKSVADKIRSGVQGVSTKMPSLTAPN